MKSKGISSVLGLFILLVSIPLEAQELEIPRLSPKGEVSQLVGVCKVQVNYGRPSVRGREIFGKLLSFDKVWRAGANEATTLTFDYDVQLEGNSIKAGTYALFMIPGKEKWTVILNKEYNQWGAYNHDPKQDVLRFEVTPAIGDYHEMLTFGFSGVTKSSAILNLNWSYLQLPVKLTTDTPRNTALAIDKATGPEQKDWFVFSSAAQYYFYELKDTERGLFFIDKAIALEAPNPAPWMLKSQILASLENYKQAIKYANKALEVSKLNDFWYELEENQSNIESWKAKL